MKTTTIILILLLTNQALRAQNILISKSSTISFFSSTVVEDIEGKSNAGNSVLDIKSRNIIFKIRNTSFQFEKKLMQEHFNENYMESDKYPYSTFKGNIVDNIDLAKDGTYQVTIQGTLDIHGVTKPYQTKATLVVNKGSVNAKTVFKVKIEDHQIKIPSLVFKNIAEYVEVRISALYQPK
jgi:Icc-related predicted phosphoesterase